MGTIAAFKDGAAAVNRNKRVILLLWLFNLAWALAIALPVFALVSETISHSVYSEKLRYELDAAWYAEFLYKYQSLGDLLRGVKGCPLILLVAGAAYVLAFSFFNGGAIAALNAGATSWRSFLEASARFFPRMFGLLVISLPLYGIIFGASIGLERAFDAALEGATTEKPLILAIWTRYLIVLALFCLVNMLLDYAKICAVLEGRAQALRAFVRALRFVFGNFGGAVSLYLLVGGLLAAMMLIYVAVERNLWRHTLAGIALVFVWQQLFIAGKIWIRLAFLSSASALYKARGPEPALGLEEAPR